MDIMEEHLRVFGKRSGMANNRELTGLTRLTGFQETEMGNSQSQRTGVLLNRKSS